jgi:hypothetical protein
MVPTRSARRVGLITALALTLVLVVGAAACSSGSTGSGLGPSATARSTTTAGPATTERSTSTTESVRTTTTDDSTTTSGDATTSTTSTTADPPTSTSSTSSTSTSEATTTTAPPRTTTTERATTSSSTSTSEATTTTLSSTVPSSERRAPWLAIGLVAALLALLVLAAVRHHSGQSRWWARVDALLRDGQALVDLGQAGPAATDPSQQVAHWSALEQRAQALGTSTAAVRADAPDTQTKAALDGLGQSSDQYLASIRNARALRIGPPAPTPEQLGFADAEAGQRLAVLTGQLGAVNQLALPHRKAPAS